MDDTASDFLNKQIEEARTIKACHGQILHASDFIFLSPESGNPYPLKTLNKHINRIVERLDINYRITPHMFRHTFATIASSQGVDSLQLQKYLGHTDLKMTNHYTHASILGAKKVASMSQILRN